MLVHDSVAVHYLICKRQNLDEYNYFQKLATEEKDYHKSKLSEVVSAGTISIPWLKSQKIRANCLIKVWTKETGNENVLLYLANLRFTRGLAQTMNLHKHRRPKSVTA